MNLESMKAQPLTIAEGYYYLAGPMSGIPQFNFPEFDRIARNLRNAGLAIVSPAELDDPDEREAALASPDGMSQKSGDGHWKDYLRRDLEIVMDPMCLGVIVIPGWEWSKGARLETFVNQEFGQELLRYEDRQGEAWLSPINRDEALLGTVIFDV